MSGCATVFNEMPFHPLPSSGQFCGADIAYAVNLALEDNSGYGGYDCFDPFYPEAQLWKSKSVKSWTGTDIMHWINSVAKDLDECCTEFSSEKFALLDGFQLINLSIEEFRNRDRRYGEILYKKLKEIVDRECGRAQPYHHQVKLEEPYETKTLTCLDDVVGDSRSAEEDDSPPPPPEKKGRGRPRLPRKKKKTEKLGRLWEFLRDLLKNPDYCPSLIVWENYEEGMFRFVHSDKVAKLWGSKKENPDMNYEKLSRAMRYYYKSKVLMPVYGRRLVYKFGPNATGWRVANPNFAN